ncbi:MAG: hypothetical protein N2439_10865 [Anaerolineae bacterium]|nr:hypothetical protein [Anaerolineae bacterium]
MTWLLLIGTGLLGYGLAWYAFRRGGLATPWHRDIAALFLLALATLGCFWRVATGQNWMPADGGDLVSFLFPIYRFAAASLSTGDWPLWNPHLYGGAPHVGDIQAGFLYPPNLALFLLQPDFPYAALQWLSMAHIWFAGAGTYLFLARGQRVRRVAALAGALIFMFSDGFFVHFGNLNYNAVMSWLPWVFWAYTAYERSGAAAQRRSANSPFALRSSLLAGVLLAIGSLAGHIQATLFIALALVFYSALWLFLHREEPASGRRAIAIALRLGICGLTAALLAAPILLPAFELSGHTARAGWNYQQTAGYSLSPAQWIGWLIPGFFGRGPQFHWGLWPRVESGYVGILPLVLVGLALLLRRERRIWLWAGVALASFLLALGIYAIPHGWLTLVPPFGQLRAPGRLVMVTGFALALLAAFGLDAGLQAFDERMDAAWRRVRRGLGHITAVVWAIVVPLAYLALLLTQDRPPEMVSRISVTLIAIMSFAGLLTASLLWMIARDNSWARPTTLGWLAAGLIFLDLASLAAYQDLGNRDPSLSYPQERIVSFLKQQPGPFRIDTRTDIQKEWQPDTALLYGLEDIDGIANPLLLADVARYWDNLGSRSTPLYDLLNIRYVIARKDAPFDWSKFVLAFDGDPRLNVYENRNVLPRAFFVPQVQTVADHEAAWAAIHMPGFDPRVTAVVEAASNLQVAAGGQVEAIRPGPNRLTLQVTANGPAFLVISQVWYPGWEVWLDGRPAAPPWRTDYLFQGVVVPEGAHRIELRFAPRGWRVGWWIAAAGLVALTGGALAAWRSGRGRRNSDEVNDAD